MIKRECHARDGIAPVNGHVKGTPAPAWLPDSHAAIEAVVSYRPCKGLLVLRSSGSENDWPVRGAANQCHRGALDY